MSEKPQTTDSTERLHSIIDDIRQLAIADWEELVDEAITEATEHSIPAALRVAVMAAENLAKVVNLALDNIKRAGTTDNE